MHTPPELLAAATFVCSFCACTPFALPVEVLGLLSTSGSPAIGFFCVLRSQCRSDVLHCPVLPFALVVVDMCCCSRLSSRSGPQRRCSYPRDTLTDRSVSVSRELDTRQTPLCRRSVESRCSCSFVLAARDVVLSEHLNVLPSIIVSGALISGHISEMLPQRPNVTPRNTSTDSCARDPSKKSRTTAHCPPHNANGSTRNSKDVTCYNCERRTQKARIAGDPR